MFAAAVSCRAVLAGADNYPEDPDAGAGDDLHGFHVHIRSIAAIRHLSCTGGAGYAYTKKIATAIRL